MKFLFKLLNKQKIKDAFEYYNNSIGSTKRFKSFEDIEVLQRLNNYNPEYFMSIDIHRGYNYFISHSAMNLFIDMDLAYSDALKHVDKQNVNLRNTFVYLYCNYDVESNLCHPMHFDNELLSINPVINRIYKFLNEVNINKIVQEDIDEFKEIKYDMYNLIHAYEASCDSYKSFSTIHSKIKDVLRVYNAMKQEKIY